MGLDEDKNEHQQLLLRLRLAIFEDKKKRRLDRSGGVESKGSESANRELDEAEAAAFAAIKLKDDIVCSLWHTAPKMTSCVVRFGDQGRLKMMLPFELCASDVLSFNHPVLGDMSVCIENTNYEGGFSADDLRLSDLFWDFLDSKKKCNQRFPISVTDAQDAARMLAQYDLMQRGQEKQVAESIDFVWISKVADESRFYAAMELTELNANDPFPDPEKGATFQQ